MPRRVPSDVEPESAPPKNIDSLLQAAKDVTEDAEEETTPKPTPAPVAPPKPEPAPVLKAKDPTVTSPAPAAPPKKPAVYVHAHDSSIAFS